MRIGIGVGLTWNTAPTGMVTTPPGPDTPPPELTLRQQIEALDSVVGRRSTNPLKVLEDEINAGRPLPAGWADGGSRRMNITQPMEVIEDWDFRDWQPIIRASIGTIRNCIFGQTAPYSFFYAVQADTGSTDVIEYCDIIGMVGVGRADQAFSNFVADIQYCRFRNAEGDYLKFGGRADGIGQRIYRNLFLPAANMPQTLPTLWDPEISYPIGAHVNDPTRNSREFISRIDNNLNNRPRGEPNGYLSTPEWTTLDPHFDAVTVNRVNGRVIIEENYFDMADRDDGIRRSGVANVIRIARDEGTSPLFQELIVRNNVIICDNETVNPIDMGDNLLGNYYGPITLEGNWIRVGADGSYGRGHNTGTWINNRDADTDALIYPDGPGGSTVTVPTWITVPSITGTLAVGQTLTANSGVTTGEPILETRYKWLRVQANGSAAAISGATAATYVLAQADLGLRVRVEVSKRNAGGWSGDLVRNIDARSAISAVIADESGPPEIPWAATAGQGSIAITSYPEVDGPIVSGGIELITVLE